MQSLFGIQLPQAAQYILAFAIVLALVAIFGVFLRRIAGGRLRMGSTGSTRARQPRLGIVDIYDLDRQRQLVLLRRDNTEHLLMIGGPNDVVVETNIVRGQTRASVQPSAGEPDQVEPEFTVPAVPATADQRLPELRTPPPLRPRPEPMPDVEPEIRVEPAAAVPAAPPAPPPPAIAMPPLRPQPPAVQPPAPPPPPAPSVQPPVRREPPALSPAPAAAAGAAIAGAIVSPPMDRPAPPPVVEPVRKAEPVPPATEASDPFADMSRQMEQALKAPFEAARRKPDPEPADMPPVEPVRANADPEPVRIEPVLRDEAGPSKVDAPKAEPAEKPVMAEPGKAPPGDPEPVSAPGPVGAKDTDQPAAKEPAPAQPTAGGKEDPFSIEAIEAEFARLLGRTDQKGN